MPILLSVAKLSKDTEPERAEDGPVAIDGDCGQSENAHVDRQDLHERAKRTHQGRQIPSLQQGRLKLNRNHTIL